MKLMMWMKLKLAVVISAGILLGAGVTALALSAPLSQQSYFMKGVLTWTQGVMNGNYPVEIFRDGDIFKITKIQRAEETNYFAMGFLCTSNMALSFSQYEKDITGVHKFTKSWNNGSITLSHFRMPQDVQLAPLWFALKANEAAERNRGLAAITIFPDRFEHNFHERPTVNPVTDSDPSWPAGFSQYSESVTNTESGVIRSTRISIQSWTNCGGIKFPASISLAHNRTALSSNVPPDKLFSVNLTFQVTDIGSLQGPIDTRLPFYSPVHDWRPREDGLTETGCWYNITNGVIFDDILKATAEHKTHWNPATDAAQSRGLKEGTLAPDFTGKTLEGNVIKLSDLRGKYVILSFWSTTCGPCIGQIPDLKATYEAIRHNDHFAMIGLALEDNPKTVKAFIEKKGMQWPQIALTHEFGDPIVKDYKVKGIPDDYVIGPDGKILAQIRVNKEYINTLLSKK